MKRLVGEPVTVSADIIADGHDVLAAELLWAAEDEVDWHRVAMMDRRRTIAGKRASCRQRIGRHRFTVQAWWDAWGTFRHDLSAKFAAVQNVTLEIEEGRRMIKAAVARAPTCQSGALPAIAKRMQSLDAAAQVALLLAEDTAAAMHALDDRPFARRTCSGGALDAERPQAGFASWYEMFPRSATGRSGAARHVHRCDRAAAGDPRHGLRRAVFPADPSDRHDQPQGPQQRAARGAG